MSLIYINPYSFGVALDPDAAAYITAVEGPSGDNQALEPAIVTAINDFVVGCKSDGIWTAILESCILAGARTVAGALIPIVGSAPTNFGFVTADYNRKTGLVGNGSSKYLTTARFVNSLSGSNSHVSVSWTTLGNSIFYGNPNPARFDATSTEARHFYGGGGGGAMPVTPSVPGLVGTSRSSTSTTFPVRVNKGNYTTSHGIGFPAAEPIRIFRRGTFGTYSTTRIAFYSVGTAINLELLDNRVTDLLNAYAAALP